MRILPRWFVHRCLVKLVNNKWGTQATVSSPFVINWVLMWSSSHISPVSGKYAWWVTTPFEERGPKWLNFSSSSKPPTQLLLVSVVDYSSHVKKMIHGETGRNFSCSHLANIFVHSPHEYRDPRGHLPQDLKWASRMDGYPSFLPDYSLSLSRVATSQFHISNPKM